MLKKTDEKEFYFDDRDNILDEQIYVDEND